MKLQNKQGFTLIEVIVAMLVLSITMVAILQSFRTVADNTLSLKRHHIAYWVASNYLIQQRINKKPKNNKIVSSVTKMANKEWFIDSQDVDSLVPSVSKILVEVFDKKGDKTPVATINGYKSNL